MPYTNVDFETQTPQKSTVSGVAILSEMYY